MSEETTLTFYHAGFIGPDFVDDQQIDFFQGAAIAITFLLIFNDGKKQPVDN